MLLLHSELQSSSLFWFVVIKGENEVVIIGDDCEFCVERSKSCVWILVCTR